MSLCRQVCFSVYVCMHVYMHMHMCVYQSCTSCTHMGWAYVCTVCVCEMYNTCILGSYALIHHCHHDLHHHNHAQWQFHSLPLLVCLSEMCVFVHNYSKSYSYFNYIHIRLCTYVTGLAKILHVGMWILTYVCDLITCWQHGKYYMATIQSM